jgi:hypothetical protein
MMSLILSQKVPLVNMFTYHEGMCTDTVVGVEFATKNIKIVSIYATKETTYTDKKQ